MNEDGLSNSIPKSCTSPCAPTVVHIDRKLIFSKVAEKLQLAIQQEEALPIQQNNYVGRIQIGGIQNRETMQPESKDFYGEFMATPEEAIESAYSKTLNFLETNKIIILDDFNHPTLEKTKSQLFLCETCLSFTEESETLIQNELDFKIEGYKKLASILRTACQDSSNILPISTTHYRGEWNDQEKIKVTYKSNDPPADPLDKLGHSLAEMDNNISFYGYEPTKKNSEGYKIYDYRAMTEFDI